MEEGGALVVNHEFCGKTTNFFFLKVRKTEDPSLDSTMCVFVALARIAGIVN